MNPKPAPANLQPNHMDHETDQGGNFFHRRSSRSVRHNMEVGKASFKAFPMQALKKVVSVCLACVLAYSSMVGQAQPQAPAGVVVPDEFFHAVVNSLHQYLSAKAQNYSGDKDANGDVMSPSTKEGLILVHDLYVRDLSGFRTYLAELREMPPDAQDKLIANLERASETLETDYHNMQGAENYFNPWRPEQSEMAAKGGYDAKMHEAEAAGAKGDTEWAATLRQQADQSPYGYLVRCRVAFYSALDKNPLLGAQIKGSLSNSPYLFDALAHFVSSEYTLKGLFVSTTRAEELRELFQSYITDFIRQTDAEIERANQIDQTSGLTEFSGPKYFRQQQEVLSQFGEFGRLLITDIQGHYGTFTSNKAVGEMATDILLTLAMCAATASGVFAPAAATLALGGITGIQIYKDGEQWYLATVENSNVENGAGALGYFQRIDTANAANDAKLNTILALALLIPQLPELKAAMGQVGNIKIIRRATVAMQGGRNAVNASAIGGAANAAGDRAASLVRGWLTEGNTTRAATTSMTLTQKLESGAKIARELNFDKKTIDSMLQNALNNSASNTTGAASRQTLLGFSELETRAARLYAAGRTGDQVNELLFGRPIDHLHPDAWITKTTQRLKEAAANPPVPLTLTGRQSQSSSTIYRAGREVNLAGYNPQYLDALTDEELAALSERVNSLSTPEAQRLKPAVDRELARRHPAPAAGTANQSASNSASSSGTGTQVMRAGEDPIRGAQRARSLGISREDIELAQRQAAGGYAAGGDKYAQLAANRANNLLKGVDELEELTTQARNAGVSEANIGTAYRRARDAGTLEAYGERLPAELRARMFRLRGGTILVDADDVSDLRDLFGDAVTDAVPLTGGGRVTRLQHLSTKLRLLGRGNLISFSEDEMNALRWVHGRSDSGSLYYFFTGDGDFVRLFDEQQLDTLDRFLNAPNQTAIKSGIEPLALGAPVESTLPLLPPTELTNPVTGAWIRLEDVPRLTPEHITHIRPTFVQSLPNGQLKTALIERMNKVAQTLSQPGAMGTTTPAYLSNWANQVHSLTKGRAIQQAGAENNAPLRQTAYNAQRGNGAGSNLLADEVPPDQNGGAAGGNGGAVGGDPGAGDKPVAQPGAQQQGGGAKQAGDQQPSGSGQQADNASAPQDRKDAQPVPQEKPKKPERPKDFKKALPRKIKDKKGKDVVVPNEWTLTICRGDDNYVFPISGGRAHIDNIRYTPFHDGDEPSVSGPTAGPDFGKKLSLYGARVGSDTVSADVTAENGDVTHIVIRVNVIDCSAAVNQGQKPGPPVKKKEVAKEDPPAGGNPPETPQTTPTPPLEGGPQAPGKCPEDKCKKEREALDKATSARIAAEGKLDEAKSDQAQADKDLADADRAVTNPERGADIPRLIRDRETALAKDRAADKAVKDRQEDLDKAKAAETKAQELLDKREEESKNKCDEKPAQNPGEQQGKTPGQTGQGSNQPSGGNQVPGTSDGTNAIGTGAGTPALPACKKSDRDCAGYLRDADETSAASAEAQRQLAQAPILEGQAEGEEHAANNDLQTSYQYNRQEDADLENARLDEEQANKDYSSTAAKAEFAQAAADARAAAAQAHAMAEQYRASAQAHEQRAQELRAEANAIREQAAAAKAAAKAAEDLYHACKNLPLCPGSGRVPTGNITIGGGVVFVGGGTTVEKPRKETSVPSTPSDHSPSQGTTGGKTEGGPPTDGASNPGTGTSIPRTPDKPMQQNGASRLSKLPATSGNVTSSGEVNSAGGGTKIDKPQTGASGPSPEQ